MSAQLIAFIIFAFMLSGMALGSYLRLVLPDEHTQADSKDILMTSAATMGTLIALIIGLLVTSAKSTYDDTNSSITQGGAKIITLDYYLSHYGSEAKELRVLLRQSIAAAIERIWPDEGAQGVVWAKMEAADETADLYNKIRELSPQNDAQKYLQTQALQIAADMMQTRWMLIEQSQVNLPRMFLSVLSFWLIVSVRPIWSVGSSKPDSALGSVHLRLIDGGRYFSYPGIKSSIGGKNQDFERSDAKSPFFNREIAIQRGA